jgi:hypothetical protein
MTDRHCIGEPEEDLWPWHIAIPFVLFLGFACWAGIWLAIELLLYALHGGE